MKKGDTVYALNDDRTEIVPLIVNRVADDDDDDGYWRDGCWGEAFSKCTYNECSEYG